jgi:hypothetical protein
MEGGSGLWIGRMPARPVPNAQCHSFPLLFGLALADRQMLANVSRGNRVAFNLIMPTIRIMKLSKKKILFYRYVMLMLINKFIEFIQNAYVKCKFNLQWMDG